MFGEKIASTAYQLGKKGLSTFNQLGSKVSEIAHNGIVQGAISFLPPPVQVPLRAGILIGDGILSKTKNFENKLNQGEDLYNKVKDASQGAKKLFEKSSEVVKQVKNKMDSRIPKMVSGSNILPFNPIGGKSGMMMMR